MPRAAADPQPAATGPSTTRTLPPASSAEYDAPSGDVGTGSPDDASTRHPSGVGAKTATDVEGEGELRSSMTSRWSESSSRRAVPDGELRQRLRLGLTLRELRGPSRESIDEPAHEGRHRDEHHERESVSCVRESQAVCRLDVEPVRAADTRSQSPRARAAIPRASRSRPEAGGAEAACLARRSRLLSGRRATAKSGTPPRASAQAMALARADRGALGSRRAPDSSRAARPVESVEITCTSIRPDCLMARLITDPRVSSAQRERFDAPRMSCVAFSAARTGRASSAMSVPVTSA